MRGKLIFCDKGNRSLSEQGRVQKTELPAFISRGTVPFGFILLKIIDFGTTIASGSIFRIVFINFNPNRKKRGDYFGLNRKMYRKCLGLRRRISIGNVLSSYISAILLNTKTSQSAKSFCRLQRPGLFLQFLQIGRAHV